MSGFRSALLPADEGRMAHPALTEPRTKEDWRQYCGYVPVKKPSRRELAAYQTLAAVDREDYNIARDRWHSSLIIVQTKDMQRLSVELDLMLTLNEYAPHGARSGMALTGPPRSGKSTAIKQILRRIELELRRDYPERWHRRGDDYIPMAYLLTPAMVTEKSLLTTLAHYYALPVAPRMTTTELQRLVVEMMKRCQTRVLVIDDIHFLDATRQEGINANNLIKALANETAATIVVVGIGLEKTSLFTEGGGQGQGYATQTGGRFQLFSMSEYKAKTKSSALDWIALVGTFEDALVLLQHEHRSLTDNHWRYLHDRTGGSIFALAQLLRKAALVATRNGTERITRQSLGKITIDYTSERRFHDSQRGAQRTKADVAVRKSSLGART